MTNVIDAAGEKIHWEKHIRKSMCPPWTLISRSSWAMMSICKWEELAWEPIRPDGQKNTQLNIYSLKKCWHRFNFLINPLLVRTDVHIVILIVDSCFDWKTMAMGNFFFLLQFSAQLLQLCFLTKCMTKAAG